MGALAFADATPTLSALLALWQRKGLLPADMSLSGSPPLAAFPDATSAPVGSSSCPSDGSPKEGAIPMAPAVGLFAGDAPDTDTDEISATVAVPPPAHGPPDEFLHARENFLTLHLAILAQAASRAGAALLPFWSVPGAPGPCHGPWGHGG